MHNIQSGQRFTIADDPNKAVFVVCSVIDDMISYMVEGMPNAPVMRLPMMAFQKLFTAAPVG